MYFRAINTFMCLALIAGFALPVKAQVSSKPKVYKILNISVEGNTTADAGTVILNSGLRIGDEVVVERTDTAGH